MQSLLLPFLPLLLFLPSTHSFHRNLATSTLSSDCVTCLSDNSKRWCTRESQNIHYWGNAEGECCASGDTTGFCSTDTEYICTDDAGIHDSGKKLLCPYENDKCGQDSIGIEGNGIFTEFRKSGIPNGSVCTYRTNWYYGDGNFHIRADAIDGNITVLVDDDKDYDEFSASLIGGLTQGENLTIAVKKDTYIFLLVEPTAATASFNITYQAEYSTGGNAWASVGIIAGSVYIGGLAVLLVLIIFCWCVKSVAQGNVKISTEKTQTSNPGGDKNPPDENSRLRNNINDGNQPPLDLPLDIQNPTNRECVASDQLQNHQPSNSKMAPA